MSRDWHWSCTEGGLPSTSKNGQNLLGLCSSRPVRHFLQPTVKKDKIGKVSQFDKFPHCGGCRRWCDSCCAYPESSTPVFRRRASETESCRLAASFASRNRWGESSCHECQCRVALLAEHTTHFWAVICGGRCTALRTEVAPPSHGRSDTELGRPRPLDAHRAWAGVHGVLRHETALAIHELR